MASHPSRDMRKTKSMTGKRRTADRLIFSSGWPIVCVCVCERAALKLSSGWSKRWLRRLRCSRFSAERVADAMCPVPCAFLRAARLFPPAYVEEWRTCCLSSVDGFRMNGDLRRETFRFQWVTDRRWVLRRFPIRPSLPSFWSRLFFLVTFWALPTYHPHEQIRVWDLWFYYFV